MKVIDWDQMTNADMVEQFVNRISRAEIINAINVTKIEQANTVVWKRYAR